MKKKNVNKRSNKGKKEKRRVGRKIRKKESVNGEERKNE